MRRLDFLKYLFGPAITGLFAMWAWRVFAIDAIEGPGIGTDSECVAENSRAVILDPLIKYASVLIPSILITLAVCLYYRKLRAFWKQLLAVFFGSVVMLSLPLIPDVLNDPQYYSLTKLYAGLVSGQFQIPHAIVVTCLSGIIILVIAFVLAYRENVYEKPLSATIMVLLLFLAVFVLIVLSPGVRKLLHMRPLVEIPWCI